MTIQERLRTKTLQESGTISPFVKMRTMMAQMLKDAFASFRLEIKAEVQKTVKEAKKNITSDILDAVDIAVVKGELTPKKGTDYFDGVDGKDVDEKIIIKKVLRQIAAPRDGKDADVDLIIGEVIKRIPSSEIIQLDTAQQIVEKVNEAKGVAISSVENLEEELKKIRQRVSRDGIQRGGGGMGNVTTQSTAISSATTTITLEHNVASNGKAIWFNYQGQQQAYGTHFTVSGKTVTLLFTPDDSTNADIIYIRK